MGFADLHIHSTYSDGLQSPAELLGWAEAQPWLDLIAVTDHDALDGGLALREAWARGRYRVGVIVGVEITTLEGHLLCYDIERPIPSWRPLGWTLAQVHAQGGFALIAHPGSPLTRSVGARGMARCLRAADPAARPDGVELINASLAGRVIYPRVVARNRQWRLPATGGSDAHDAAYVGSAGTFFPGTSAADFRRALRTGQTVPGGRFWSRRDYRAMAGRAWPVLWRALVVLPARRLLGRPHPWWSVA